MSLDDRIALMVDYLKMKTELGDWHAVADAAMDLRELELHKRLRIEWEGK